MIKLKPIQKIRCGVCGKLQGSQICKSCSRKVSGFLAKGVSPEAIPDLMFSTIQTTLDFEEETTRLIQQELEHITKNRFHSVKEIEGSEGKGMSETVVLLSRGSS